ncbi:hypothetical protein F5X68DRAFT_238664 [Plectosphaerella plurivora]|uniref:Protein kinase domain-containing protein n=1 Tax=Plectosphaerella plurivora TaxID=936078 RepID=A0A9P8VPJ0_9PEZI|nr:hypothetical protein F5X68DRAFT_238664 [Plectosphaerella plurivora]
MEVKIQVSTVKGAYGKFVPADVIESLTSREAVEAELKRLLRDSYSPSLLAYVLEKPAKKVFLTLLLQHLERAGMSDEHLPIEEDATEVDIGEDEFDTIYTRRSMNPESKLPIDWDELLKHIPGGKLAFFISKQWLFIAPVFTGVKFRHQLNGECPLPFLKTFPGQKGGYFSSITKASIHVAHQKNAEVFVALKRIDPEHGSYFLGESKALQIAQKIPNPHLITPIAAYIREGDNVFVFPWADGGNLREHWATETSWPLREPTQMLWVLRQMCGIAHALKDLHHVNCRHGDLKPENVLHFKDGAHRGTIRIADVGLAKSHIALTQQRLVNKQITNTKTGTIRYLSPEFGRDEQISRLMDVWALGCVFVEYLIWLEKFNKLPFPQFWAKDGETFVIEPAVQTLLTRMAGDLGHGSSRPNNALQDILDGRSDMETVHLRLSKVAGKAENEEQYLIDPEIRSRVKTRQLPTPTPAGNTLTVPAQKEKPIASLPSHSPDETEITTGASHVQISVSGASRGDKNGNLNTGIAPSLSVGQQALRELNDDVWKSQANNNFARTLFARKEWSLVSQEFSKSSLCPRCSRLDPWGLGFTLKGRVGTFNGSQQCDLCTMVYEAVKDLKDLSDDDQLECLRRDSAIQLQNNGPKLLSIYIDPATTLSTPPSVQVGFPTLPELGSPAQLALFDEWINVCRDTHSHPGVGPGSVNPDNLPTRLVDGEDMRTSAYFALSHCWGHGPRFCLLKGNLDDFRQTIREKDLPKSFQDAVTVTRGLTYRYLWIDSLCIIQDDDDDWKREAGRMQEVFSNALCVLAASSASSSAQGFLHPPRPSRKSVCLESQPGRKTYISRFIDNFQTDVEDAVLNTRGWVLQERALARRTIHFTTTQTYFECGMGVYCESLTKLNNDKARFLGDSEFPTSILPFYKDFRIVLVQELFEKYSRLGFSKQVDRSIAISGLEERLTTVFETRGGFGIFESYLERTILWQRLDRVSLKPICYPADREVPSWSWMAYEGGISYLPIPFEKVLWTKEYNSPFDRSSGGGVKTHWEANASRAPFVLRAHAARKMARSLDGVEFTKRVTFDVDPNSHRRDDLRCVVFGKEKAEDTGTGAQHYVLVISAGNSAPLFVTCKMTWYRKPSTPVCGSQCCAGRPMIPGFLLLGTVTSIFAPRATSSNPQSL